MKNTYSTQLMPSDIKAPIKTIRVDTRVWDKLKDLKRENETFNEVILELLNERTKASGNENIKAILYKRKIDFLTVNEFNNEIGIEFEYNDVLGHKSDFELDLKIRKVFFTREVYNPSEFFGVDNAHKQYSEFYLMVYFLAVAQTLKKEFRIGQFIAQDIVAWRKLYYYYNLSEDSFTNDIEEPLRLSMKDKASPEWQERLNNSVVSNLEKKFRFRAETK